MKPLPWSFTHWDEFNACPRLFAAKRVKKTVKEPPTEAIKHGIETHTAFELRMRDKKPLPTDMKDHEPFMETLEGLHGRGFTEYEACLNMSFQPCGFWDKDVWLRQKIDYKHLMPRMAYVCDYKTGNPSYPKPEQLMLNALHIFIEHPQVEAVKAEFYWTKTHQTGGTIMLLRSQKEELWGKFTPTLRQMREAYAEDIWQPRPNFRCYGFCPLTDCEYWKPKRNK